MKRNVTEYVSKCLTCQQVKAEHEVPSGLLKPIPVSQWKWDNIAMDFVYGLPLTKRKHDSVRVMLIGSQSRPILYQSGLTILWIN